MLPSSRVGLWALLCSLLLTGLLTGCVTVENSRSAAIPTSLDRVLGPVDQPLVTAVHIAASVEDTVLLSQLLVDISHEYLRQGKQDNSSILLEQLLSIANANPRYSRGDLLPDSLLISNHLGPSIIGSPLLSETFLRAALQFWQLGESENAINALNVALYELRLIPDGDARAQIIRFYIDTALRIGDVAYEQINNVVKQLIIYSNKVIRIELLLYYSQKLIANGLVTLADDLMQHALTAAASIKDWSLVYAALLFRQFSSYAEVNETFSPDIISQFPAVRFIDEQPPTELIDPLALLIAEIVPSQINNFLATISDPALGVRARITILSTRPGRELALPLLSEIAPILNEDPTVTSQEEIIHQAALAAIYYERDDLSTRFLSIVEALPATSSTQLSRFIELAEAYRNAGILSEARRYYQRTRSYRGMSASSLELQYRWYLQIIRYDNVNGLLSDLLVTNNVPLIVSGLLAIERGHGEDLTTLQKNILALLRDRF